MTKCIDCGTGLPPLEETPPLQIQVGSEPRCQPCAARAQKLHEAAQVVTAAQVAALELARLKIGASQVGMVVRPGAEKATVELHPPGCACWVCELDFQEAQRREVAANGAA